MLCGFHFSYPLEGSAKKSGMIAKKEINGVVALTINNDKASKHALKWAIEHLLNKGQTLLLIHARIKKFQSCVSSLPPPGADQVSDGLDENGSMVDQLRKEVFLPYRCFCTRKNVKSIDVILEDDDVVKAIVGYASRMSIQHLVVGASSKFGFFRDKDIPGSISKAAPDFCSVYVITKGKISIMRSATSPVPSASPVHHQIMCQGRNKPVPGDKLMPSLSSNRGIGSSSMESACDESDFKLPFTRKGCQGRVMEHTAADTDISFVFSTRPSIDRMFPSFHDMDEGRTSNCSNFDFLRFDSMNMAPRSVDTNSSQFSISSESVSSHTTTDEIEAEMRRLKMELMQTMEMYSSVCKDALSAKHKAQELQRWMMEEERKIVEAQLAEEAAMTSIEGERAKYRVAMEHAESAQQLTKLEVQKRIDAERKAHKEAEEKKRAFNQLSKSDDRCRKYSIEEIEAASDSFAEHHKIGGGGYGSVYKCYLDYTTVAIKVLRPDAAEGRIQFQQEVEILSRIRHPNVVLLLGACPEIGCLVYEYMANGSLDDLIFRRGNSPPLPWRLRFIIAAEICTGLLFLHQTKPELLVHSDLKPANILLDCNCVSKISDVGLARLVPPSVANAVTRYQLTSAAGTFCYIDPEYQQSGMLCTKSDIYSLGILLLQLVTARSPMGLSLQVSRAIENGTFAEMLDPTVPDWPVEAATDFAKMALKCAELRRKDRPDLGTTVLPELNRLRRLAEASMNQTSLLDRSNMSSSSSSTELSGSMTLQDEMSTQLPESEAKSSSYPSRTLQELLQWQ